MQPQAALFSFPPHRPSTSSGGTSWNALKIHCKPHEIDPGRVIAGPRVCIYVCTECARIIVGFLFEDRFRLVMGKEGVISRIFDDNIWQTIQIVDSNPILIIV